MGRNPYGLLRTAKNLLKRALMMVPYVLSQESYNVSATVTYVRSTLLYTGTHTWLAKSKGVGGKYLYLDLPPAKFPPVICSSNFCNAS